MTGPKRDCQHPIARHEHGTRNGYVCDRCRCEACRQANTVAERARTRAKAYGRYDGLVDAEPAREHIRRLAEQGIGLKQITRVSGVSGGVLTKLLYGHPLPDGSRRLPSRRCTPRVRDRILAVKATDVAAAALVDATGTRRRLQALVAVGWSQSKLADLLGMARASFGKTIRSDRVYASTARAVTDMYEQLWNTLPPRTGHRDAIAYSRAVKHARDHGWPPPLAWDDDTIGNPNARPMHTLTVTASERELDELAIEEACAGRGVHLTREERAEAVRRLTGRGLSAKQIGERLGVAGRSATRLRARKDAA